SNPPLTYCSTLRASERQLRFLANAYSAPIADIQPSPDPTVRQTLVLRTRHLQSGRSRPRPTGHLRTVQVAIQFQ
ncbi:MAG: hypothetical protein ABTQ25_04975, partial [Nitrosomonas ureae]